MAVPTERVAACVSVLPNIFLSVMKGISAQVCLFIGQRVSEPELATITATQYLPTRSGSTASSTGVSSPGVRRKESSSRSQFYTPTPSHHSVGKMDSFYINITPDRKSSLATVSEAYNSRQGIIGRPSGNTLLHIFGNWLFEAAVWEGQDQEGFPLRRKSQSSTTVISSAADISRLRDSSLSSSYSSQQRLRDYESGRAEAFAALCTIFSKMPCGEDIMKVYLARFYHSMYIGLKYDPQACSGQVLTKIILMSSCLLRKDFPGANALVLPFLTALEKILGVKNIPYKGETAPERLRRSSILLLLSILPLPLHFIHLNIPDISHTVQSALSPKPSAKTFFSLRNRVLTLLFNALDSEDNATNTQMLLHALMVYLQDLITYEHSIQAMLGSSTTGSATNSSYYREDISFSTIFRQAIVCAHGALIKHSRDNTVTLASLELLSGLAKLQFDSHTHVDCRDAVQWVCEFIETQAQEKPFLQTKDLHTSIVAAFKTLMVWVMEHPHLIAHESCLSWLLRVTEFGITGQFSKHEDGNIIYKEEKTAHPVSGRVKEIAEFMLYCVLEKFGSFPSPCGAAASGSLLTEEEIIKRLKKSSQGKFKYYLVDNSMIIGLLEGSFTDGEDSLPTVTAVIRGPAGRQVWSLQMRQHPRSDSPSSSHLKSQPRPVPTDVPPPCPNLRRPPWPKEVNSDSMKLDEAIPHLDTLLTDPRAIGLHQKICELLENEQKQQSRLCTGDTYENALEPPAIKDTFDTVRLFLNHLGLLSIDKMKVGSNSSPSIATLDSSSINFRSSLAALDRMPSRYCDSIFVLYCKKGQLRVEDILSHQHNLHSKPVEYMEFLQGLGWVVDPIKHPGFSGKLRPELEEGSRHIGLSAQIPYRPFPYYADAISEVAFIQPTLRQSASNSTSSVRSVESSDSGPESGSGSGETQSVTSTSISASSTPFLPQSLPMAIPPTGSGVQESLVQADGDRPSAVGGKINKGTIMATATATATATVGSVADSDTPRRRTAIPQDCAAMVVWLECYEDHCQFPIEKMSKLLHKGYCKTNKDIIPTIFVHKLSSGLYQVTIHSSNSTACGPLISGMVVSRRCLSVLVRATAGNLCFSHRLENEGYSPPHVKRKRKIEDVGAQFSKNTNVSELYTELICN